MGTVDGANENGCGSQRGEDEFRDDDFPARALEAITIVFTAVLCPTHQDGGHPSGVTIHSRWGLIALGQPPDHSALAILQQRRLILHVEGQGIAWLQCGKGCMDGIRLPKTTGIAQVHVLEGQLLVAVGEFGGGVGRMVGSRQCTAISCDS